jgi:hypothetical protein
MKHDWRTPLAMLAFGGFISLSLWAKWNPVQAQDTPQQPAPRKKPIAPSAGAVPKPAVPKLAAPAKARAAAKKSANLEIPVRNKKDAAKKTEPARQLVKAGQKLDPLALARLIDQEVARELKAQTLPASPLADDAEFLRRVYLDLVGVIPTPDQVLAFLDSKDSNKRQKVIDELLADERFGRSLAEAWSGLMIPRESNNRRLDHKPFQDWLTKQFNDNVPLDKMVFELLTSTGSLSENGAVGYFVGNPTVDKMTDNVSKMFLGVRLECAQCHNHPFVSWKQEEYWGMAAFFMKTRLTVNPQQAAKKGVSPGIFENASPAKGKKGNLPESAKFVPAKFLQAEQPKLNKEEPYRPVLAKWVTAPDNPFFARAMVNRFWQHLFGRGIVNPVDDMHEDNVPSHPDLLEALTQQFKASGFDLKYLLRAIASSEAYQRSSRPVGSNADDKVYFSHRTVRTLTPEQLHDSLVTVLGRNSAKGGDRKAFKGKGVPGGPREQFLAFFRVDEADPQEYQAGIPQALRLMNSSQLNATQGVVDQASKSGGEPNQIIEQLYLIALSRRPTTDELRRMNEYVSKQPNPRAGYSDVVWALLNSSEFTLNH